jgi:hypothetical protein
LTTPIRDQTTAANYRGVSIMRHAPMVLRDDAGQEIAAVPYSFTVDGMPMMAETLEIAYVMIDSALNEPRYH